MAKENIVPYVKSVVNAIIELHAAEIAHQDIRLENICFNLTTEVAVLIDLDRSCSCSRKAEITSTKYGKSTMYLAPCRLWTADMMDWRQLAILIYYISNEDVSDYHDIVVRSGSPYITTMFREGKFITHSGTWSKKIFFCRKT